MGRVIELLIALVWAGLILVAIGSEWIKRWGWDMVRSSFSAYTGEERAAVASWTSDDEDAA